MMPRRPEGGRGEASMSTVDTVRAAPSSYLYYRHTAAVRIMHWINVIALTVL